MLATIRKIIGAVTGRNMNYDAWYEAEAAEVQATLKYHLGIVRIITADDVRNHMRWSTQARREQFDLAWRAQARREQLNTSAIRQNGDDRDS